MFPSNEVKHGNSAAWTIRERQKGARSGDSSVIETSLGSSTLFGFFSRQLLGDSEDRITVVAPSGKLGLVVSSSPSNDTMPMIVQIKNKSVLTRKVKVGDLLLSVDEVDCRGMSKAGDGVCFVPWVVIYCISAAFKFTSRMLALIVH